MGSITRRSFVTGSTVAGTAPFVRAQAPPPLPQTGNRPNLIFITCDTWSVHWLGCYGAGQVRTPHVDALAAKSAMFMDCYPQALPTVPTRRAIYTGRQIFPADLYQQPDARFRGWHQLYMEDVTLSETLRTVDYRTALVSDVYHQFQPTRNFHRGFDAWRWVRGQESDAWQGGPRKNLNVRDYVHPSQREGIVTRYLINRQYWRTEDDWPCTRLFREAGDWLESNYDDGQPLYLHIESYSPHEFWDPPEDYYRLYMKSDYNGPRLVYPPTDARLLSPVELEHVRALYAGMITFADTNIGRFMERIGRLGMMDNTVIVFTTDHGAMMGEQNYIHKHQGGQRTQLTHVPLMIYYPGQVWAGRKVQGFVQHTDMMPTVLDILGVQIPQRVTGESMKPLIETGQRSRREKIFCGWDDHGTIRTPEWLYQGRWNPGESYEEVYDLRKDPLELNNVNTQNTALMEDCRKELKAFVDAGWATTRGTFFRKLGPEYP